MKDPFRTPVKTLYSPEKYIEKDQIMLGAIAVSGYVHGRYYYHRRRPVHFGIIFLPLGSIWEDSEGFEKFVKRLCEAWLHEYLHLVLEWEIEFGEWFFSDYVVWDDERAVQILVHKLNGGGYGRE